MVGSVGAQAQATYWLGRGRVPAHLPHRCFLRPTTKSHLFVGVLCCERLCCRLLMSRFLACSGYHLFCPDISWMWHVMSSSSTATCNALLLLRFILLWTNSLWQIWLYLPAVSAGAWIYKQPSSGKFVYRDLLCVCLHVPTQIGVHGFLEHAANKGFSLCFPELLLRLR